CVNMSEKPWEYFDGYYGACSTYGSFSYLKYGPMRLFSQTVQDSDIKLGKVIWVAGHSGPETADDSRTHFGIFAPAVTQLFPEGHVIDLHPYDYNDAIVLIAAALKQKAPIIALHMTRPPVKIADRKALGMAHYFEAAKGAYLIRDYTPGKPKQGCIFVQGTMSTQAVVDALPEITKRGWNIKVVAAVSPQLFALQSEAVRNSIVDTGDWADSMCITNRARRLMNHWIKTDVSLEYSMGSDFDDMWRTGGTLEDVLDEAHLTVPYILDGIGKFIADRDKRLARLKGWVDAMTAHA
ncbi:MAG: transketolase, partial [Planctomycetota bacterium]